MSLDQVLRQRLHQRRSQDRYRQRRQRVGAQQVEVIIDGRRVLNFCANDYLGLANHPDVVAAFTDAARAQGVGSGASHLVSGHSDEHHALEQELAAFTGRERALLFSTGYMANLGVIKTLVERADAVFQDKLNHASLLDGGLLCDGQLRRYRHNDCAHLQGLLNNSEARHKLIAVDGVFSMDGDLAPLQELAQIARDNDSWLMIDDAHGLGVLGDNGGGCTEHFGLTQQQAPVLMGTLGKSLGTFGAFVAGSEALIEALIQFARSYIYTTALPPAVAAATRVSLQRMQAETWRRQHLHTLIARFRAGADAIGARLLPSSTPIQPLLVGDDRTAMALSEHLMQQGIWVSAIRPPTVPEGTARLRITLSAAHTEAQVDRLLAALASAFEALQGHGGGQVWG